MTVLFLGRRRLRWNSHESLVDDHNVSDTWAVTRDTGEAGLAVRGCDPTRDTRGPPPSPASPSSPPFLSPRASPGPGPHHSQSRLWLLSLVLVTLLSCAGQSLANISLDADVHIRFCLAGWEN